jgi:hypothetical protein
MNGPVHTTEANTPYTVHVPLRFTGYTYVLPVLISKLVTYVEKLIVQMMLQMHLYIYWNCAGGDAPKDRHLAELCGGDALETDI